MKPLAFPLAILASIGLAGAVLAAPASAAKLRTFAEGGSVVTVNRDTVTIDNTTLDGSLPYNDGGV